MQTYTINKNFLIFPVEKILHELSNGILLHKVKNGGILYPRTFYIDTKNLMLRYSGSEKRFRRKKLQCKYLICLETLIIVNIFSKSFKGGPEFKSILQVGGGGGYYYLAECTLWSKSIFFL